MVEARDRLRLLPEARRILARRLLVEVALADGLDRDRAVELRLGGLVNLTRRAAGDLALQLVAAQGLEVILISLPQKGVRAIFLLHVCVQP
jgi:hypothetical protein